MRVHHFRILAAIAMLLVSTAPVLATPAFAGPPTSGRVGPAARAAAAGGARVRVMVVFEMPSLETPQGRSLRGSAAMSTRIASARSRVLARVPAREIEVVRSFTHVNAMAVTVDAAGLERLANSPDVKRVDLDLGGQGHLNEAVPLANIDTAQNLGLTGSGITVALLDSGYDSDHVDLADDLVGEACFCGSGPTGCCPGGGSVEVGTGSAEDDNGHGTNVSGIVTGAGNVAPAGGAPDAGVVAVKVLDFESKFCCTSNIVAGLDWVIQNRPDVDIVSMSLGTLATYSADCDTVNSATMSLASAIDTLRSMGVAVFASSGNDGSSSQMTAPACIANAISVGAVWDADFGQVQMSTCSETSTAPDQITCFSNSSGTTDLVAPGASTSATGIGGGMSTLTGTSQAAPLAASCAALMLEDDPTLLPEDIEAFLEMSPTRLTDAKNGLDYPRVDCRDAILVPEPGKLAGQLAGLAGLFFLRAVRTAKLRFRRARRAADGSCVS